MTGLKCEHTRRPDAAFPSEVKNRPDIKNTFFFAYNLWKYLTYLCSVFLFQPENLQVVPPIMVLFAKYPKVCEYDLSSVKRIVCAAAPLSAEIEDAVTKRLNVQEIQQGNR